MKLSSIVSVLSWALWCHSCAESFAPRPLASSFRPTTNLPMADFYMEDSSDFSGNADEELEAAAELDEQWKEFQQAREASKSQIRLSDFSSNPQAPVQPQQGGLSETQQLTAAGVFLLAAVLCLVGVYFSGEPPVTVAAADTPTFGLEGVFRSL